MKGIVFTLLEHVVSERHRERFWDGLLGTAGLDGAYTAVGSYPDEEFHALVQAASAALGRQPDDVLRWFGRQAMPSFAERYAHVFVGHTSARSFMLTLNDVIHPEVRKLLPGAYVPEFEFDASDPERLALAYVSTRRLCAFAEGLMLGAGDHFGEAVVVGQSQCVKLGDPSCILTAVFPQA